MTDAGSDVDLSPVSGTGSGAVPWSPFNSSSGSMVASRGRMIRMDSGCPSSQFIS